MRIENFLQADKVYSLDRDCPDYGVMLAKRKDVQATVDPEWTDAVSDKCRQAETLLSEDLTELEWLTIGDSHTPAVAPRKSRVVKMDGSTLYGLIESGAEDVLRVLDRQGNTLSGVTLSYGNIDVRHHLLRPGADDWKRLWERYDELRVHIAKKYNVHCEIALPWPVEHEERRIPKTGWYKGTPFYGPREARAKLVDDIRNYVIDDLSTPFVMCPEGWYDLDPEEYAKGCMEFSSSVHLSPQVYRSEVWGSLVY